MAFDFDTFACSTTMLMPRGGFRCLEHCRSVIAPAPVNWTEIMATVTKIMATTTVRKRTPAYEQFARNVLKSSVSASRIAKFHDIQQTRSLYVHLVS